MTTFQVGEATFYAIPAFSQPTPAKRGQTDDGRTRLTGRTTRWMSQNWPGRRRPTDEEEEEGDIVKCADRNDPSHSGPALRLLRVWYSSAPPSRPDPPTGSNERALLSSSHARVTRRKRFSSAHLWRRPRHLADANVMMESLFVPYSSMLVVSVNRR